jgi:hypothetical protein
MTNDLPPLRPLTEIVRAHDLFVSLILDDNLRAQVINLEDQKSLIAAADVLCWVLQHTHNRTFAGNLASIEARLSVLGIAIVDEGEPLKNAVH